MTRRLWAIVALVAVVALGAGVGFGAVAWAGGDGATAGASGPGGMMTGDMASMTTMPTGEREFMQMMVAHHRSAIAMAELVLERTERPEVRRLAEEIIEAQQAEVARMQGWYEEWFGEPLRPDEAGGMMDMSELENAGEDFDRVFLRMMIAHHASAIVMAESLRMGEPRGEIAMLAEEIVAAQAKEIGQMQSWRERWYAPRG